MTNTLKNHHWQASARIVRIILSRYTRGANLLVTQPVTYIKAGTIKIIVGYIPVDISKAANHPGVSINVLNVISDYISQIYGTKVDLVFVRINNHYSDANTLVQYLALLIGQSLHKSHTSKAAIRALLKYMAFTKGGGYSPAKINKTLKGLKIRVSGRLTTEPTRPRQTVHEYTVGNFKLNRMQSASHTSINAKGSTTIKVWLAIA